MCGLTLFLSCPKEKQTKQNKTKRKALTLHRFRRLKTKLSQSVPRHKSIVSVQDCTGLDMCEQLLRRTTMQAICRLYVGTCPPFPPLVYPPPLPPPPVSYILMIIGLIIDSISTCAITWLSQIVRICVSLSAKRRSKSCFLFSSDSNSQRLLSLLFSFDGIFISVLFCLFFSSQWIPPPQPPQLFKLFL